MMSDPDADYVCTLTEASIEKAERELHENPNDRLGPVKTLREWILSQKHLTVPTDTSYLLRMLRQSKGSQLKARSLIENTCQLEQEHPDWFKDRDTSNKQILKFFKTGYFVPLGFNKDGEFVILERFGAMDPKSVAKHEDKVMFLKALNTMLFQLVMDENVQVNGVHFFTDCTGLTLKHEMIWTLADFKVFGRMMKSCTPLRMKSMQIYNTSPIMEAIMAVCKPLMPKKLQDRMYAHGSNMESVYKTIPKELFPAEYLPDDYTGPMNKSVEDLIADFINKLTEEKFATYLREYSSGKYSIDLSKKTTTEPEYQASFRKLNVE